MVIGSAEAATGAVGSCRRAWCPHSVSANAITAVALPAAVPHRHEATETTVAAIAGNGCALSADRGRDGL